MERNEHISNSTRQPTRCPQAYKFSKSEDELDFNPGWDKMGRAFREGRQQDLKERWSRYPRLAREARTDFSIEALAERARFARTVGEAMANMSLILTLEQDEWLWQRLDMSSGGADPTHKLVLHERGCDPAEICYTHDFDTAVTAANELAAKCGQIVLIEPIPSTS